jgi:hypothetical protein
MLRSLRWPELTRPKRFIPGVGDLAQPRVLSGPVVANGLIRPRPAPKVHASSTYCKPTARTSNALT